MCHESGCVSRHTGQRHPGEVLRGGAEKVAEAGAVVVGGHSVNDKEPKYGLAVTGIIDPALVKRKGGALPGDILLVTKPLGVGILTTALKQEKLSEVDLAVAVAGMKKLNRAAAKAALAADAHAMTDITGFGLLGHAREMAEQSGADFWFALDELPFLPNTAAYAADGAFPGGMGNNQRHFGQWVSFAEGIEYLWQDILFTPETSGGLLIAISPEKLPDFQAQFNEATVIGRVTSGDGRIHVER
ncbi:MAG: selenide, water dikinase SelD [Chloroflexota bacterium]